MVPAGSTAERERLLTMARKLYRFVTPIGLLAVALGFWLWFGFGSQIAIGGWLHAKTALVAGLLAYHFYCGRIYRDFLAGTQARSHVWFRVFNEVPVLALLAICILAVVKPF
jgi:putative membrane protein